jgi:hypothetical protein
VKGLKAEGIEDEKVRRYEVEKVGSYTEKQNEH